MQKSIVRMVRAFLPVATCLAAVSVSWCAQASDNERTLHFYNIHTKERAAITYKRDGKFLPEGMKQINHMMRDWRRDEPTEMDPELIDTIWEIYQDVGAKEPIHLVSGYRSKKTNERLRRRRGGQARKSQHILGKAADIHFPDVPVKRLRNSALVREVGGVGYYPKSGLPFVHVDTGRVRHWPRIGRQELAAIFPDGKTKHVPRDGRPLTPKDGAIAMAKLDKKIDAFITKKSKIALPKKMMMAGFTPPSFSWNKKADPVTTASIPDQKAPTPPADRTASLRPPRPALAPVPKAGRLTAPSHRPEITISAVDEAEHPEELIYQSTALLPLLSDASVMTDRALAQLTAPGADNEDYLLRDPEGSYSQSLARGLGYRQELRLVSFGQSAGPDAKRPVSSQGVLRTASR